MKDINTSPYFDIFFRILAGVIFVFGVFLLDEVWLGGFSLMVISVLILTTHFGIQVDPNRKVFREYVWVGGWKFGEEVSFEKFDHAFITRNKHTIRFYKSLSSGILEADYNGYLSFDDASKILVFSHSNKQTVRKKLNQIASSLGGKVIDYTEETGKDKDPI
jgi:hypothetical protein